LQVVEFDNLATGKSGQARWGSFHIDDIRHVDPLVYIIRPRGVETVVHLAAAVHSGESVANPSACYSNHVSGTFGLIEAMLATKVRRIVFASSFAVYRKVSSPRIGEDHAAVPVRPYGESKLITERALKQFEPAYGFKSVCLRYFNIIEVFGTHYDTGGRSAVRDYVQVRRGVQSPGNSTLGRGKGEYRVERGNRHRYQRRSNHGSSWEEPGPSGPDPHLSAAAWRASTRGCRRASCEERARLATGAFDTERESGIGSGLLGARIEAPAEGIVAPDAPEPVIT
jgi:hypothetical protein